MDAAIDSVLSSPSLSQLITDQGQYFAFGLALGMFVFLLALGIVNVISLLKP